MRVTSFIRRSTGWNACERQAISSTGNDQRPKPCDYPPATQDITHQSPASVKDIQRWSATAAGLQCPRQESNLVLSFWRREQSLFGPEGKVVPTIISGTIGHSATRSNRRKTG